MFRGKVVGIRPPEPSDLALFTRLANDPSVRQSVVGWDWPVSEFSQKSWLEGSASSRSTRRFTIVDLASGDPIGLTGFWEIDWHNRSAVSGIKIDAAAAPKGAGTDAIMLASALAFYEIGLHRLWATILDFNVKSLSVYVRKCRWRIEGTETEAVFRGGTWHDLYRVALLRSEFDQHPLAQDYLRQVAPLDMTPQDLADGKFRADWL